MSTTVIDRPLDEPSIKYPKYDHLDGVRALAAIWVVISHFAIWPPSLHRIAHLSDFGHFAVVVFIVLSGFCLALPVARSAEPHVEGGYWKFMLRRARRILPAYYAALALALALNIQMGRVELRHILNYDTYVHLALVHDIAYMTYGISPQFWSIALEWHIYFFFPLFVHMWKKMGAARMCLASLAVFFLLPPAYQNVVRVPTPITLPDYVNFFGLFTMGMLGAEISYGHSDFAVKARAWKYWGIMAASVSAVVVTICICVGYVTINHVFEKIDYLVSLAATAFLVWVSVHPQGSASRFLSCRTLSFVAGCSYSWYLSHYLFGLFAKDWVAHHLPTALWLPVSVFLEPLPTLAFAWVFSRVFERPFMVRR